MIALQKLDLSLAICYNSNVNWENGSEAAKMPKKPNLDRWHANECLRLAYHLSPDSTVQAGFADLFHSLHASCGEEWHVICGEIVAAMHKGLSEDLWPVKRALRAVVNH